MDLRRRCDLVDEFPGNKPFVSVTGKIGYVNPNTNNSGGYDWSDTLTFNVDISTDSSFIDRKVIPAELIRRGSKKIVYLNNQNIMIDEYCDVVMQVGPSVFLSELRFWVLPMTSIRFRGIIGRKVAREIELPYTE